MSARRPPATPPRPRGGGAARAASEPQTMTLGETEERRVTPDSARSVLAPGAEELAEARESVRPRYATPTRGPSLRELVGDDDDEDEGQPKRRGYGPVVVVMHDGVTGPGTVHAGGPLSKGRVVSLSELLGDDVMHNEAQVRQHVRRYMELGAIREATAEEAQYDAVTFLEGEEQLGQALESTQAEVASVRDENARLAALVEALQETGGDVEEAHRLVGQRLGPAPPMPAAGSAPTPVTEGQPRTAPASRTSVAAGHRDPGTIIQRPQAAPEPGTEGATTGQPDVSVAEGQPGVGPATELPADGGEGTGDDDEGRF